MVHEFKNLLGIVHIMFRNVHFLLTCLDLHAYCINHGIDFYLDAPIGLISKTVGLCY